MTFTKLGALALSTALVSTAAFADGHIDRTGWPESFTLGTASQGGTYFAYGSGWANLVADELGLSGGAEVTGGPMQNMALVHTGEAQFGMTTMGPAADSIAGNNPIAPGLQMTNACAMFPMYQTPFYIAALASSGITSVSEIPAGALMGFGPAGSTADTYFPRMMESLGAQFERRNGGFNDMGSQLQDGLLDVWGVAGGIPTPAISQLEASTEITIIEMTEDELASILENFPVTPFSMPADTYEALDADSPAVSMWNFAIANCDLPDSFVYSVVDVIMADNERMVNIHRAATATLPENWDTNNGVMMWHPGAAQWFTENAGAEIPADQIFGG